MGLPTQLHEEAQEFQLNRDPEAVILAWVLADKTRVAGDQNALHRGQ